MKSKIIIEIETEQFASINSEEDLSGDDITEEFENDFHNEILIQIKRALENKEGQLYDTLQEVCLDGTEIGIEDFENFNDYAKILNFKVESVECTK